MSQLILVTGGCGYIGSHTCVALIKAGYTPLVLDNLSNSKVTVLDRIHEITNVRPIFIEGDVRDRALLTRVFAQQHVSSVIHFAGYKAVGESVQQPLAYYENNLNGTLSLLQTMQAANVKSLVFSSSATVYGNPHFLPVSEDSACSASNPYGRSKLIIEDILSDLSQSDSDWRIARLRYFNPAGAHESALIGEDPQGIPNNLVPYLTQVAIGRFEKLYIYGADWPTLDGTGVRDYIHVMDLAEGHLDALSYILQNTGMITLNLGRGQGTSVLQLVQIFSKIVGRQLPYEIVGRRAGDIGECWADARAAYMFLGWRARRGLEAICEDAWRWQQRSDVASHDKV